MLRTVVVAVLASCALLYVGDYTILRFRRNPTGTVQVQPYYAVPLKDGKTEFMFLDPQNEVCVYSLFSHLGHRPCWYISRHRNKQIKV
jgi:hypothetical protein